MQDVPIISYQAALESLEALRLFRLRNPHVNSQRGEQVQVFCIEKSGILRLYKARLGVHPIRLLSRGFLGLSRIFPSYCMYCISRYKKTPPIPKQFFPGPQGLLIMRVHCTLPWEFFFFFTLCRFSGQSLPSPAPYVNYLR